MEKKVRKESVSFIKSVLFAVAIVFICYQFFCTDEGAREINVANVRR